MLMTWKEFVDLVNERLKSEDITNEIQIEHIGLDIPSIDDFKSEYYTFKIDIDNNTMVIW